MKKLFIKFMLVIVSLMAASCADFLEIDAPKTQIVSSTVYTDNATATSAMMGVYSRMMENSSMLNGQLSLLGGWLSDELDIYSSSPADVEMHDNAMSNTNAHALNLWSKTYQSVYYINAVLEGLASATGMSASVKDQLEGEARFLRAMCYFYLVNVFGDVPLILTTDYRVNAVMDRTAEAKVYDVITEDLLLAKELLPEESGSERVRPDKWAATAMLARVSLYTRDWNSAEAFATEVIEQSGRYELTDVSETFLASSPETIWQLKPVVPNGNTVEGAIFTLNAYPVSVALREERFNALALEDERRQWVGSIDVGEETFYFPHKYKATYGDVTEYNIVLRLAEQYLIRAEARAQLDKLDEAKADLDVIRSRAGLSGTDAIDKDEVLEAIVLERQVELFAEFGHRWFDLKRTGLANDVLGSDKGSSWQATDVLFPIPQSEIQKNGNLDQNLGY